MTVHTLCVIHHSHTDVGFTNDQPIVWELERRFIDAAIDAAGDTAHPRQVSGGCEVFGHRLGAYVPKAATAAFAASIRLRSIVPWSRSPMPPARGGMA